MVGWNSLFKCISNITWLILQKCLQDPVIVTMLFERECSNYLILTDMDELCIWLMKRTGKFLLALINAIEENVLLHTTDRKGVCYLSRWL